MVLRKITIDNSVRYIPKNEQTKEIKQNPTKNKIQPVSGDKLNTRNQNKKVPKNNKKFVKDFTAGGFAKLK